MAGETLFGQGFTQTGEDTDADTGWTFATQMSSSNPAAFVREVLWAPPTAADGAYDWRIYSGHVGEPRALIASGALGSYLANNAWQTFPITPVDVSGINFMVGLRSADGHDDAYAYATGKWPHSSGSLSGPGAAGGAFSSSGGTPDNGSALFFMIDAGVYATAADEAQQASMSLAIVIDLAPTARRVSSGGLVLAQSAELAATALAPRQGGLVLAQSVAMAATPTGALIIPGTLAAGSVAPAHLTAAGLSAAGLTPA